MLSGPALQRAFCPGSIWGKGILGAVRFLGELSRSVGSNEGSKERECRGAGVTVRVGGWAGTPSTRGPHLGQGFDAHQIHKADPTHVEDEGVEGDKGWDAGQDVTGLSRGRGLTTGSCGAVRAEGDVGHAGAISRRLVVVGVRWGAILKVLLKLLQGDSLEGGSRRAESGAITLSQTLLWLKLGQGACGWRELNLVVVNISPQKPIGPASPIAPSLGGACTFGLPQPFQERHRSLSPLCSERKALRKQLSSFFAFIHVCLLCRTPTPTSTLLDLGWLGTPGNSLLLPVWDCS